MREILYKGKPKNELIDWVYGYYFYSELTCKHYIMGESKDYGYTCIEVIPETVGQYTELNDKNGTKIFEGDIVKYNLYVNGDITEEKETVRYSEYTADYSPFSSAYSCDGCCYGVAIEETEVIGNIHDTPELLNGEGVR